MRISGRLCGVFAAICYFVAATSAQPSCGGVADFGPCNGDAGGFCPSGIGCSCKGGDAFCNCPNYKGPNTDYWYMGEKCNYLWSTWDLVVMVVFPAGAIAFVVAVVAQWIHFCKTTNSKQKKSNESRQIETAQEEPSRNSRSVNVPMSNIAPQSPQRAAAWSAPERTNYYTEAPPAGRNADYAEIKRNQSRNLDKPSYGFPDQDYDPPRQAQQFVRPAAAPLPQADYGQDGPGWGNRPFTFKRPQVNYGYE